MSLIKCPECNHDMSSYADKCPNCGFPNYAVNTEIKSISNSTGKLYNVVIKYCGINHRGETMEYLYNVLSIDKITISQLMLNLPRFVVKAVSKQKAERIVFDLTKFGCEVEIVEFNTDAEDAIELQKYVVGVRCPQCGSANFTTGSRGYSFWTGFLGSSKTVNRCAKCGHTWQPK